MCPTGWAGIDDSYRLMSDEVSVGTRAGECARVVRGYSANPWTENNDLLRWELFGALVPEMFKLLDKAKRQRI